MPPLVRQYLFELHGFVREAREFTANAADTSTTSPRTSLVPSASRQSSVQSTPSTPRPSQCPTSFSGTSLSALDNAYYASLLEADPSLLHLLTPARPSNIFACPHERPASSGSADPIETSGVHNPEQQLIRFTFTDRCSFVLPREVSAKCDEDDAEFKERRARWQRIYDSFQNPLKKVWIYINYRLIHHHHIFI